MEREEHRLSCLLGFISSGENELQTCYMQTMCSTTVLAHPYNFLTALRILVACHLVLISPKSGSQLNPAIQWISPTLFNMNPHIMNSQPCGLEELIVILTLLSLIICPPRWIFTETFATRSPYSFNQLSSATSSNSSTISANSNISIYFLFAPRSWHGWYRNQTERLS